MRDIDSILYSRDVALAGFLIKTLKDKNIFFTDEIEDSIIGAVTDFQSTPSSQISKEYLDFKDK